MDKYIFEAKTKEEAIKKASQELKITEENMIIEVLEEKQGILKKLVKIQVINVNELINYIKDTITEITTLMNININLEVRRREKNISITIFSDNNPILIGKNGRAIQALQNIIRQIVLPKINNEFQIIIDVGNYKENRIHNIEYLAKKTAKEVAKTKIEAKLDSMNSYERRAVHNILSKNKYVYTESYGEEPNRYVVIKPKEEV